MRRPLSTRTRVVGGVGVLALLATVAAIAIALHTGADAGPTKVEVSAVEDTYTSDQSPARNFGDAPKLVAGTLDDDTRIVYLKFTVPPIAAGLHVSAARLVLTRGDGRFPATTLSLSRVADTSWSESTLTGDNAPLPGELVDSVSVDGRTNAVTFDLSGAIARGGRYAFAVTAELTDGVVRFNSSERTGGPRLVLELSGGSVVAQPRRAPGRPVPSPAAEGAPAEPSAAAGDPQSSGGGCSVSATLVPSCGRWHGVAPLARTSTPRPAALADFERRLGAPVDIMHVYHSGSQLFPTDAERKMATEPGRNRILLINWKPSGKWADVAAGRSDAQLDRLAAHITSTFAPKFFLAIFHEPENNVVENAGSGMRAEDFRAMFRHVVQRLREKGVTNAVTIMNYMGAPKFGVEPWFGELYPGDDVADWVAYDPYGMGEPGFHGGDFGDLVNRGVSAKWPGMYNWLTKFHPGRPIMLGEWGVGEFTRVPQNKAKVFETMSGLLGKFPAIKALVYFDSPDAAPFGDTRIDSTPASLAAYRRLTSGQPFAAVGPPHLT